MCPPEGQIWARPLTGRSTAFVIWRSAWDDFFMAIRKDWTRDELLVAFRLYCRCPSAGYIS